MTDEAAESPRPATTGAGPAGEAPSSAPTAYEPPAADASPAADPAPPPPPGAVPPGEVPPPGASQTPPAGGSDIPPPPAGGSDIPPPPPWFGAGEGPTFAREKLVRPARGRYVAGVCAAFGQATNTDPVLWRVLLGVLSFLSGVGILIYLVAWLLIPGEGDTASPLESLLGRGRSGMQPVSVVLLAAGAVLTFALVVKGGFPAALIAVAAVVGGALLLKRAGWTGPGRRAGAFPWSGAPQPPAAGQPTPQPAYAAATAPAEEPMTAPLPPYAPPGEGNRPPYAPPGEGNRPPYAPPGEGNRPPYAPPAEGYRPPYAPHGPWASRSWEPAQPPPPPRPPRPPRERSKLGRITFFAVLLVIGAMALVAASGAASIPLPAYFAAALVTIALGLIVGAWFGRARGLIFLAFLTTLGLAASTGAQRWGGGIGDDVYRPTTLAQVADRYDFTVGRATIDLRGVDFRNAQQNTTITLNVGQVEVLLPPTVDATVSLAVDNGRAVMFGQEYTGTTIKSQQFTDLGTDGAGGGALHLSIQADAADVEVSR